MKPSSEDPVAGGYLLGLLADGARPFRYRRGVHDLLGMPGAAGSPLTYPPPLPPALLKYEKTRFVDDPEARVADRPTDTTPALPSASLNEKRPLHTAGEGGFQQHEKAPAAMPKPTGPPEKIEIPDDVRQVGLAIPGVTTKRWSKPMPKPMPSSPAPQAEPPQAAAGLAARSPQTAIPRPVPTPRVAGAKPEAASTLPSADAGRSAQTPVMKPAARAGGPGEVGPSFSARRRVHDEVEQLRRAVKNLAARQSAAEARQEQPAPPPAPPPRPAAVQAAPPVVVVQATPERRAPRALWSTGSLRSTHLRMLR